jgi:hypothetical protein
VGHSEQIERRSLPPVLASIFDAAGAEAALAIADQFGGTRRLIPVRHNGNNWLFRLVGADAAKAIISQLGAGRRVDIPLAAGLIRRRRMDATTGPEMSAARTARAMGITDRTVRLHRARRRAESP